jgi:spermidine synthase
MGRRIYLLYLIFFCSGASALTFETLWFRQAGLVLGNSVWASSMVLAAFMAGLACGNWFAGRKGELIQRPIRAYGWLEVLIATSGLSIVLLFPHFNTLLLPVLKAASTEAWLLNLTRLGIGFSLLLLPTAAMGATLPMMVKGLGAQDASFGERLGRLYACNTLGAVAGTLFAELFLIEALGIRGTGIAAAACSLLAGLVAVLCDSGVKLQSDSSVSDSISDKPLTGFSRRLLFAAFLAGGTLLALEVVWFRLMLLFSDATSRIFAVMLSVVLTGIAVGGVLGSRLSRSRKASTAVPIIASCSGILTLVTYMMPSLFLILSAAEPDAAGWVTMFRAIPVMLPVSVLSGMLFTLIGNALHEQTGSDTKAAGYLTLCNTGGAMLGAICGGFLLLPNSGLDGSFFMLASVYLLVALVSIPDFNQFSRLAGQSLAVILVLLVTAIFLAPRGVVDQALFRKVAQKYRESTPKVVAVRETVTGTLIYTQAERMGYPYFQRLITDGHSMSATAPFAWQYMKMYVYLPVALHPAPRKSLLISYGCGVTAKALTDTAEFEVIDFVDISKDILELNSVVYPDPKTNPLNDPRVNVIIEDGRYHLQTTEKSYDLITSEPPPPKNANIVNLYTREYFQLIHDRLAAGGMTTYWLPQHSLSWSDSKSIIRAFCDVFDDCSMWIGSGDNWMMLGVKDGHTPVTAERFRAQWDDDRVLPILAACGFETPEQLVSYFIADEQDLRELTRDSLPLVDNFPHRLSPELRVMGFDSVYPKYVEHKGSLERLKRSKHIARLIPDVYIKQSEPYFEHRDLIHDTWAYPRNKLNPRRRGVVQAIHPVLTKSQLLTPVLWTLGSGYRDQRIVDRVAPRKPDDLDVLIRLGIRELANRNYSQASEHYSKFLAGITTDSNVFQKAMICNAYALCMADRVADAQRFLNDNLKKVKLSPDTSADWEFLQKTFPLHDPMSVASPDGELNSVQTSALQTPSSIAE